MSDQAKLKVVFAPGVLENMEATIDPFELQELLDHIKELADSGKLTDDANLVDWDTIKQDDPELFEVLRDRLDNIDESTINLPHHTLH